MYILALCDAKKLINYGGLWPRVACGLRKDAFQFAIIFTENSVRTLPSVALGLTTLKLSSVNRLIISLLQSKADLYR